MDERYDDLETACANCKLIFRFKNMKINTENNRLVCINCFNNPNSTVKRIR